MIYQSINHNHAMQPLALSTFSLFTNYLLTISAYRMQAHAYAPSQLKSTTTIEQSIIRLMIVFLLLLVVYRRQQRNENGHEQL